MKRLELIYVALALFTIILTINAVSVKPPKDSSDSWWLDRFKKGNSWLMSGRSNNFTCYASRVLYPYGPECADEELSKDLYRSPRIDLGFNITVMGHKFDKVWVNQNGYVSFQESFYGAAVPNHDWPQPFYPYHDDPVFIAPFYAQTDLLGDKVEDVLATQYGRVLYKVLQRRDLPSIHTEEEKFMYEMSMKMLNDGQRMVRESISGVETFVAGYAIVATWKSLAFGGTSVTDVDAKPRNTFQLMLITDTNHTFAIFNYDDIQWYASTTLGGNPETGTGGKAAKIGFNRGNGTMWYGVKPFSENAQLMLKVENHSNIDFPGRYVFRIDEWIQPGGCMDFDFGDERVLQIWPRAGNMLGGQEVNITGPCFHNLTWFYCKWGDGYDAPITIGEAPIIGDNKTDIRARCIQPLMYFIGRINLTISLDGGKTYEWRAEFSIVDPLRYPSKVELVNVRDWHMMASPPRLVIRWDRHELSYAESDPVDIELWGYYEDEYGPHWDKLQVLGVQKPNKGSYGFDVAPNRAKNQLLARIYKLGAVKVSLFDSHANSTVLKAYDFKPKHIWSALHPIGWWRNDEMKFYYDKSSYLFGSARRKSWTEDQCAWWHQYRKYDRFWMDDLEICPPTISFAIGDIGVWMPDPSCNMYGSKHNELNCLQHPEAVHCVITMRTTSYGSGNRCCYDKAGNLIYTNDSSSGSTPDRYHFLGMPPYNSYGKVPALSHYFHDIVPFYLCCEWGNLCDTYLYARQTKDAKGYKEPRPAFAYGDPHLITFDGKDYTFNGKGEFTLLKSRKYNFKFQARFEQPPNATYCLLSSKGQINATRITAVVAGQDDSDYVEVRARIYPMQTEILRCDVLVNGKTYYFNYTEEKVQIFKNVFVYSPWTDKHQSNITIMFNSSGVGVQVGCKHGNLNVRVSAPYSFFKETSGLFGYWDNITANDFMSPDNSTSQLTLKPDLLYQRFGMAWRIRDESESLFTYSGSWNFDTFHDNKPIIREWQRFRPWFAHTDIPFPSNVSFSKEEWERVCEGDEQCLYDAAAMGSLDIGADTRDSHRFYRVLHENMKAVNSCGIYLMQGGVRTTSTGNYLTGSRMKLSCKRGYILFGWSEFVCNWNGTWLPTNGQWLAQFRDWPYCEHYHITAIRWTAIGISILWVLFVAFILIRRYCCKKQQDYVVDDKKVTSEAEFPFNETNAKSNPDELDALSQLDSGNYSKDGFENSKIIIKQPSDVIIQSNLKTENNINETEETASLIDRFKDAQLNLSDRIEAPAMIVQIPHPTMKEGEMSTKIYELRDDANVNNSLPRDKPLQSKPFLNQNGRASPVVLNKLNGSPIPSAPTMALTYINASTVVPNVNQNELNNKNNYNYSRPFVLHKNSNTLNNNDDDDVFAGNNNSNNNRIPKTSTISNDWSHRPVDVEEPDQYQRVNLAAIRDRNKQQQQQQQQQSQLREFYDSSV